MILVDTGPLVALIDKGQGGLHKRCVQAQQNLTGPLITTWPCFTEAMYFLADIRGWSAQDILWQFIERGALRLHEADDSECVRICTLMYK